MTPLRFTVVGSGRAGSSFRFGLERAGWTTIRELDSRNDPRDAGDGADLVILAVPDEAIAAVAEAIEPTTATVIHISGATTLEPLAGHPHHGSVHPLVSLTGGRRGADALHHSGFAVASSTSEAGDRCASIVEAFDGSSFVVSDDKRSGYHATAAVAANHLVALCAQVERLSEAAGVPAAAFWPLMQGVLRNVEADGASRSLTGPVARADWSTVARHLASIGPSEYDLYSALAKSCSDMAGQSWPANLESLIDRPAPK